MDDTEKRIAELEQKIAKYEKLRPDLGDEEVDERIASFRVQLANLQNIIQSGGVNFGQNTQAQVGGSVIGGGVDGPVAGHDQIIVNEGGIVVIGKRLPDISVEMRRTALGRYLEHVIAHNRYLQLQGIRAGGRLVHIELEQIYITLRATQQASIRSEEQWLTEEAALAPGELQRQRLEHSAAVETVTVRIEQALADHRRLVVLGDPGSGKTTLLRYLALVYGRDLADAPAGSVKDRLGLDEGKVMPILLQLRHIGAFLRAHKPVDDGTDGCGLLLEFLFEYLKNERLHFPKDLFDPYLKKGQAVILFDGLDEVAEPGLRGRVARLVEAFTLAYPDCRYVVTSRVVGYSGTARLGCEYSLATVRDFTLEDVRSFLSQWHRLAAAGLMGPGRSAETYASQQTEQLMQAIQSSPRIRELAINPLMLTVIALVHRDRVRLPDRRAELYAEAVEVLLGKWDEAKNVPELTILDAQSFDSGDKRLMLQEVALAMHERREKEISAETLHQIMEKMFADILVDRRGVRQAVERFQRMVEERTGLLIARGEGSYAFSHLTFQEYLAAVALAGRDNYIEATLKHSGNAWWREVILLQAGYLSMQSKERTGRLIKAIADQPEEPILFHNLVLAAECLRDVGSGRVLGSLEIEVQQRLRKELEIPFPDLAHAAEMRQTVLKTWIERRGAAMQALARAGAGYWKGIYGEPEWVVIPAGEFWMGAAEDDPNAYLAEKPLHKVYLPVYQIARTPVNNAQYALFVKAADYPPPAHFEAGVPPKGRESHPVVNVRWDDALAYCAWLTKAIGKPVTLPSEAQWEKAARGPATTGEKTGRRYPWGEHFEAACCNSLDLGLRDTSPVGVFLEGASPYGVLDLSGNVWEWTRSAWMGYPYDSADRRREDLTSRDPRVVRGGSFTSEVKYVRGSFRRRYDPVYHYGSTGFRVVCSPIL